MDSGTGRSQEGILRNSIRIVFPNHPISGNFFILIRSKREIGDAENVNLEEKDVFARLKVQDSKVSSRAADYLINNYEENKLEIASNLKTIMNSQAALF